jgi:hypothetical protein
MTTHDVRVRASTYGKEPTWLAATINEFNARDRMRRGFRAYLPCLGAACVVLLLPPHILWFLLANIVGLVQGRRRYNEPREIVSLAGACPSCGAAGDLPKPAALPAIQRCAQCGEFLKLEELPQAS